ncbi:hypothetical protein EJB05_12370 [Eragrostis curvula]|uniref:Endonuclease/exonuclease/phosphatase domain-containing protein n=1 Tax=Eragrostis curvula TaxID=38414 RepID=A0A5J9VS15_9POAL|nr:hypothetical protein EJB05_12370 [Eragrostis curvula]
MIWPWVKRLASSCPPQGKTGPKKELKLMTYNVWSREDVVVYKRMQAIADLVQTHDPDVIFFQEITPYIHSIFEKTAWWNKYHNSLQYPEEQATTKKQEDFCLLLSKVPLENFARREFPNSPTSRGYLEADINPDPATAMKPLRLATTQLERPIPPASMNCLERQAQAKHAINSLSCAENVVFGGDMSWDDNTDGPFPSAAGWLDAWTQLKTCAFSDWTHDAIWNEEAVAFNGHVADYDYMRKRSDRFVCKLKDYKLSSIERIGDHALGLHNYTRYYRSSKYQYYTNIYLKPSCHRGLVLTIFPA